jgi:hypothetical protein
MNTSSPGSIYRNGFSPTGTAGEFDLRHDLRGGVKSSERLLKTSGDYIDSCLKRLSGDNCIDLIMYQVDDFHSFRQLMHEPIDRPDHEVGSRTAHTHPDSAFIYATVLEGAIRSKINNGPEKVYRAGESWAEVPGDHHAVSANASDTQPARLLAVFVVDTDEKKLITPDEE